MDKAAAQGSTASDLLRQYLAVRAANEHSAASRHVAAIRRQLDNLDETQPSNVLHAAQRISEETTGLLRRAAAWEALEESRSPADGSQ
jgi:xanthine dehydrogenase molybdopterin-binding subunit B